MKNVKLLVGIVGSFYVLVSLTASLQSSYRTLRSGSFTDGEGGIQLNSELVKLLSFGMTPLVVDVDLIRMHVEERITHVRKGEFSSNYYDLNLATDLDPRFRNLYFYGANFLTIVRGDHQGALNIIRKGTDFIENSLASYPSEFRERYWGDPWRLYLVEGYLYLFQFHDLDRAGESYKKMADYPGTPPDLKNLGHSLQNPAGIYRVGHNALNFMMENSRDADEIAILKEKDRSLLLNYVVYQANMLHRDGKPFPKNDPLGGKLYIDEFGNVGSTTSYEKLSSKMNSSEIK